MSFLFIQRKVILYRYSAGRYMTQNELINNQYVFAFNDVLSLQTS